MRKFRLAGGKERKYTEDLVSSVSELYGEKYRQRKLERAKPLSSDEDSAVTTSPVIQWAPKHIRSSEAVSKPKAHSARPSLGAIDEDEMSESELVIRRIIESRQPKPEEVCPLQISHIMRDLSGERKQEEDRKWRLRQHLLELLECEPSRDLSPEQKSPDSLVSSSTLQGPGSSFLISATYERKQPIPEFHQCARQRKHPGRSRSISTHVREDTVHSSLRLRSAAETYLPDPHREAVMALLDTQQDAQFLVALKDYDFAGLYEDYGGELRLRYAAVPMPTTLSAYQITASYRFDTRTGIFQSCDSTDRDAFTYEYV